MSGCALKDKRAALNLWATKVEAIVARQPGPAEVVAMKVAR